MDDKTVDTVVIRTAIKIKDEKINKNQIRMRLTQHFYYYSWKYKCAIEFNCDYETST